jgi:phytoene dehydrogenase-like protein
MTLPPVPLPTGATRARALSPLPESVDVAVIGYDFDGRYAESLEKGVISPGGAMITSGSLKDPGFAHAPAGVKTVEVMTLVHPYAEKWGVTDADALDWGYRDNERYEALKADLEQQMVDRLEALFPGTEETIVFRESATPVSHVRYTRAAVGTGYGIAGTPAQYMDRRPGPRTSIRGLYVCGASTRGTAGILGCLVSGCDATLRILEDGVLGVSAWPCRRRRRPGSPSG